MYKYLLSGFLLIFLMSINTVLSQTSGGSAPGDATPGGAAPGGGAPGGPGQAPSPLDFPEYIITPSEDLNQFENTRIKRTKTDYRKGQSTLTKPLTRKSNAEVNAEIEKRRAERQKALEQPSPADEAAAAQQPAANGTIDAPGASTLYSWKDKDGILHVTDDLSSVPPEYRDQAYNSK
jgi:hypothetical protein